MKNKKGFTLVELLVVISIIAILLAVLMPALSKAREQGRRIVCLNLFKTFGTACELYLNAYNGYYPPFSQKPLSIAANTTPGSSIVWDERWVQNRYFRRCISANRKVDEKQLELESEGWEKPYMFPPELRCPAQPIRNEIEYCKSFYEVNRWRMAMSIAMNTERWCKTADVTNPINWMPSDGKTRAYKAGRIKQPGKSAIFIESNYYQTRYYKANYETYWDKYGDNELNANNWAQVAYRHAEKANILFFDGHAKTLSKVEIFYKKNRIRGYTDDGKYRNPEILWDVEYPLVGATGNGVDY